MLGIFGRDGKATKVAENIPVVGLFAAGAHALAGNEEQAKRAAMKSKNRVTTVTGGLVDGAVQAGKIVEGTSGAVAGAGVATVHAVAGNEQEAKRAANQSKNSLKTATDGVVDGVVQAGGLVGGTAGAVAGSGAGMMDGQCYDREHNSKMEQKRQKYEQT